MIASVEFSDYETVLLFSVKGLWGYHKTKCTATVKDLYIKGTKIQHRKMFTHFHVDLLAYRNNFLKERNGERAIYEVQRSGTFQ